MKDTRPYWKVIVSLAISLTVTVLVLVLGYGIFRLLLPFVLGWIIASIANPMVCWLEKKLKIVKKLGSAITIVLVLGLVVGLLYLIIWSIVRETSGLMTELPKMYNEVEQGFQEIGINLQGFFKLFPEGIRQGASYAKSIPAVLIGMIVMILSAYFFVAEREEVIVWMKKVVPTPIEKRLSMVWSYLVHALGGYFKAQLQIMLILGSILFVGFVILGVKYAVVLALLFSFLDFLPFFGTAITLLPWALYQLLSGNYKVAIGLVVLYVLTQLIRQLIQPKLVGDEIGLKPLPTLFLLYIGYRIGSIWGMIFAVPVGMIVINMYKAGAFEYITNDVKILIQGIKFLRH